MLCLPIQPSNTHTTKIPHAWHAGGLPVTCIVTVSNTGNVGLASIALSSTADGAALSCVGAGMLDAQTNRTCTLSRPVSQVRRTRVLHGCVPGGMQWAPATARVHPRAHRQQ